MILTDAGPLVAITDSGEQDHEACVECLSGFSPPMLTTWPVLTEAIYLLGEAGGWRAQRAILERIDAGDLEIGEQDARAVRRMTALMAKYEELPMDLADASLVCLAEERGLRDIFTLDRRDFSIYRLHGRQPFRIWP